ncbi:hypothetical protein GCM10020366_00800 [Saccharopolyspora gregorii]|uniref:Uncharacterized protein n=1 Tax=Saccharopolyspora gregorii TaxID=33914 RepID=A0ABP6RFW2_9PSEU
MIQLRAVTERPGGAHELLVVGVDPQLFDVGFGADRPVRGLGLAGALGGVFRDVGGEPVVGDLPVAVFEVRGVGRLDGADVDLPAPGQFVCPPVDLGGGDPDLLMGGVDRIREEFRTGPGGCFVGGAVGSVEADDGVEVDRSAPLVFGDLGVGQRAWSAKSRTRIPAAFARWRRRAMTKRCQSFPA